MERTPNRLIHEKSPYLQQHAHNPVDWFPWGEEAFALAKAEDKPLFVSIGYSTCHWCHVMERESFEDEEIGALMRATVVAVKVDREERPDLDALYMTFCQVLTGRGGWPLNVVLTPEGRPFFADTYFPKESGFGHTGMRELLQRIYMTWKTNRQAVLSSADQILAAVREQIEDKEEDGGGEPEPADLATARAQLASLFDAEHGGFGGAPKFPSPHNLLFLLQEYRRTNEPDCLAMVQTTLSAMRRGGIFDHVGLGFHRYATDARWFLPHFEKMLYDQALLAMAYTEGWQETGEVAFRQTALDIFEYVRRDLTSPEGVFYCAEDADSEGVEGKFYVWTTAEILAALPEADANLMLAVYGMAEAGNFHEEATGVATGANILSLREPLTATAARLGMNLTDLQARLERCRLTLLAAREKRPRPLCDDKVLTDLNGLMIAALAKAARAFDDKDLAVRAQRAAAGILTQLGLPDGRLLHRLRQGEAAIDGMLDDYAFLAWGLIELYQTVSDPVYLHGAVALAQTMLLHFADTAGGFFLTPDDGEALLVRQKIFFDAAVPSGNSVAFFVLTALSRLTGEGSFQTSAAALAKRMAPRVAKQAAGYTFFLSVLSEVRTRAEKKSTGVVPDPTGRG